MRNLLLVENSLCTYYYIYWIPDKEITPKLCLQIKSDINFEVYFLK